MKRNVYYQGIPDKKWGIWNCQRGCFQFSVCEDTPMLAMARLFHKIGADAKTRKFEPRQLSAASALKGKVGA